VDDLVAIGEFAELTGLSPKRLRNYASAGLLVPAAVDSSSGYRYYAPGQARDARLIDALREAGIALVDIASLLRDPSVATLDAWAAQVHVDAAQRRDALESARRLLTFDAATEQVQQTGQAGAAGMTTLRAVGRSDVGQARDSNEDAIVTSGHLAIVADGMGGHPGGEVAAGAAVSIVQASYTGQSIQELEAGVRAANRAIWDRAAAHTELQGMGTTICAVGLTGDGQLAVVNVGDSRAYLVRDGVVRQLTDDHSLTAEMVRRGDLDEAAARDHPLRGVITRVLGGGPDVEADSAALTVGVGDRICLCTDGLFNELLDDEISELLAEGADLDATLDRLIERALELGARDNVSVVLAEVTGLAR
jgi:serine/threonine protein phosphatase PrpC